MKTLVILALLFIASISYSQSIKIDSIYTGHLYVEFDNVSPRFPVLTLDFQNLTSADSMKIYNLNELGDTTIQGFKNFASYNTIDTVLKGTGSSLSGDFSLELMNPSARKVWVKYIGSRTIITIRAIFRKRFLNY